MILLVAVQLVTGAGGIPQAIPPTAFACEMMAADGSRFSVSGTTPPFRKGADPNASEFVPVRSTHSEAFRGRVVGIDPGDAGEWFREFQINDRTAKDVVYTMQLMLRREGASIAHMTRYVSGVQKPYEYHSVGLCKADFAAAPVAERG